MSASASGNGWGPSPSGWFAVAFSTEVPASGVVARHYFGQDLVVFRTATGAPAVLDAHCPHMGAHLGHGGRVEGETIRCPFHGFCFDSAGRCVSTPYAARVPPAARARAWPVSERNGVILVWHDAAGHPPTWDVPEVRGGESCTPFRERTLEIAGDPQETTENAVDLGHLSEVHGYQAVEVLSDLAIDGPCLSIRYAMSRPSPFGATATVRAEFTIHVHGLGVSFVDVTVPRCGLHTQHFVHATPIAGRRVHLRCAMRTEKTLRPGRVHWLLGLLPRPLALPLVERPAFEGFLHDIQQDVRIWEHRRYVDPPALAAGDGPVGRYRQWSRQFYTAPGSPDPDRRVPPPPAPSVGPA